MKISVSILNNTDISYFHIDGMDGNFVKQISIPVEETLELSKVSEKKLDIHLMHSRPLSYIEQIKDLKNDPRLCEIFLSDLEELKKR